MWAGAHIRPIPASTPQLTREAAWIKETVKELPPLIAAEPFIGVTEVEGIDYMEEPDEAYKRQTKESFENETGLAGYKILPASQVPPGVTLAFSYQTYCFNSPLYCQNLLRKFLFHGGKTLARDIKREAEAFILADRVSLVVNASGVGFGDPKCFPTRGQTIISNMTTDKTITRLNKDGSAAYIIPRFFNGGTILGGTREPNNWSTEVCPTTRDAIWKRNIALQPYICDKPIASEDLRAIAHVVGRRPTREGGMRVETETVTLRDGKSGTVVHAYGAGSRGYEMSWGVAKEVTGLVKNALYGFSSKL